MTDIIQYRFRLRRGTADNWYATNDVLLEGEFGLETDTGRVKIGDGVTGWNGLPYRFETPQRLALNIGDGAAKQIDITHNFGTYDVTITVFSNSEPYDDVYPDVQRVNINTVRLTFSSPPTQNQYRVIIRP